MCVVLVPVCTGIFYPSLFVGILPLSQYTMGNNGQGDYLTAYSPLTGEKSLFSQYRLDKENRPIEYRGSGFTVYAIKFHQRWVK